MAVTEVKKDIFWVGAVDWDLRDFHGYLTQRGSSYNAYLILDEKVALIDTVKVNHFAEMLKQVQAVIDPAKIDYIISNHVEMDHSGSLPLLKELAPQAKIITSVMGEKGLRRHYKKDWDLQVVKSGDTLSLGKRTLNFVHTPMVHWPDNMVTYVSEDKVLFSNDAFGQHMATSERFDDEIGWDVVREEAAKYYANIVMPYGDQTKKALEALFDLKMELICPSHGIILRSYVKQILAEYIKWSDYDYENKALIVYDTMWGSTQKMALALREGLKAVGVPVTMRSLKTNHISDILSDIVRSRLILIGSPTLNNGMLPSMGAFLTYIKGLRPRKKVGMAFGSFGWGGQAVGEIEKVISELGWEVPSKGLNLKFIPDPEELEAVKAKGKEIGEYILKY